MSSDGSDRAVALTAVTKRFPGTTRRALLAAALPTERSPASSEAALTDLTMSVRGGEVVGIIGPNGAGKTTLLKVAAGIVEPSDGTCEVRGHAIPMLELGMIFHPELTGRENLPAAAALMGSDPGRLGDVYEDVVAFSGVGRFLDIPVKHLSTGMVVRLAFALATHLPADVLLIDEVLSVGDRTFQQQCVERVRELAAAGTAVLFASHSMELVRSVAGRAVRLDGGRLVDDGPVDGVVSRYTGGAPPRALTQGARAASIRDLRLHRTAIDSGTTLDATCRIEVEGPGPPLRLASEIYNPGAGDSAVNLDRIDGAPLGAGGSFEVSAVVGPIPSTAGRLDLVVTLLCTVDGVELAIDRRTAPFRVRGELVGATRMAMRGDWATTEEPARPLPPPRELADPGQSTVWCRGLVKRYRARRHGRVTHAGIPAGGRDIVALDDVGFSAGRGESIGVIGSNGAGKSTLLRVLADITDADRGEHRVRGRCVSVLELGTGFHRDLSGEDNLAFTWRAQGGDRAAWRAARDRVVELADIGPVLDEPVKHYSLGMTARLTLAIAVELAPDLLIVDEALSVGDLAFRRTIGSRLAELVAQGTTLLFATHDLHLLAQVCDRVVRLDEGRLVDDGPTAEVIARAGGAGWAGGTTRADGDVALSDLRVPASVGWGDAFDVELALDVVRPAPLAHLDVSIRSSLDQQARSVPRTPEEVLSSTMAIQRLDGRRVGLDRIGRRSVRGRIQGLPLTEAVDLVVSVVDGVDGEVSSEVWQAVQFGRGGTTPVQLRVVWTSRRTVTGSAGRPHPGEGEGR